MFKHVRGSIAEGRAPYPWNSTYLQSFNIINESNLTLAETIKPSVMLSFNVPV